MASNKSRRHTHKYEHLEMRENDPSSKLWVCRLPDCTHIMPKHYERTIPGKASICWECGNEFVLDFDAIKQDRPTCIDCRNPEVKRLLVEKENQSILEAIRNTSNEDAGKKPDVKSFVESILNGIK